MTSNFKNRAEFEDKPVRVETACRHIRNSRKRLLILKLAGRTVHSVRKLTSGGVKMDVLDLKAGVEAVLINARQANRILSVRDIAGALRSDEQAIEEALKRLEADLNRPERGFLILRQESSIQLVPKPQFVPMLERVMLLGAQAPMSRQAVETLAIIAVKQPITTSNVNSIRGVDSAGPLRMLLDRRLIERVLGVGPTAEKCWGTTPLFLQAFNLTSIDDIRQRGALERVFPSVYGKPAK